MNNIINAKNTLISILNVCCGMVTNVQQIYNSLPSTIQHHIKNINAIWNGSQYPSAMWVLNYLNTTVYKRPSYMKMVIKKFMSYNSSNPMQFNIPPNTFIA